ncbi:tetratricopeptide repeat protein [Xanthomarina sp. F2636L]|uniref:tetratricopeptide repeat protein n=1 Tax=Xanthomarina sp. F2636L TaxID=2996018 RepID=UPI00225DEADB|nr:tetratricopeptide repeat protein [Xanthomarina sp. F2636L]MCX7551038.1 tetratricopeptide repeat protein [Xanthomarina sp. F2636L]
MKQLFWIVIILIFISCENNSKKESYVDSKKIISVHKDGYVGDEQCMSCHKQAFDSWKDSDHDLAMQVANGETILADFNDVEITLDGITYFFSKKDSEFFVHIKEIDGSENDYKISYAFGIYPLQQYLVDFENGKKQALRVTWDVDKKQWYHQYSGDAIDPHDWMHWTESSQNWNTMCAECHSTNLQKNYIPDEDRFNTTWSSINVSCESCHGPAEKHVNWANNLQDSLHNNKYILAGNSQFAQMNMCATCHSRRVKLTENMVPGTHFEDQYLLQNLSQEFYHGDGQIEAEDYVYGSFLQSKMYHNDVTCTDCHNPHSLKLKEVGNKLCMQCHEPKYDQPTHHFHPQNSEGSQCINCHMTGVTYMGIDYRRDHSFRVPRPDQSVEYGTPNACNTCHADKTNQWAANKVVEWYGAKREAHFSDALLLSSRDYISKKDRDGLDLFINDLNYPAIARASVIDNLQITESSQYQALIKGLEDPSPMVRYAALQKFRGLSLEDRTSIALKHTNDTTKLVRIGAAQLLLDLDFNTLTNVDVSNLEKSRDELETMLYTNADFSSGRMQLGDYYLQTNDVKTAIKHYRAAIKKDSLFIPAYSNLASSYSINNQPDEALKILNLLVSKSPETARPYYLRALIYFELKQNSLALEDLNKAISLEPTNPRYLYNLATYYYQNKSFNESEKIINQALKIEANNPDFKFLLALIYQEQGKLGASRKIMQELNVQPGRSN